MATRLLCWVEHPDTDSSTRFKQGLVNCDTRGILNANVLVPPLIAPYPHLLVSAATTHSTPIRAPIKREYLVLVAWQIFLEFPGSHIPHLQGGVFAAARE